MIILHKPQQKAESLRCNYNIGIVVIHCQVVKSPVYASSVKFFTLCLLALTP